MKNSIWVMISIVLFMPACSRKQAEKERMCSRVDLDTVVSLLPKTTDEVTMLGQSAQQIMNEMIQCLDLISVKDKTFANTVRAYDVAKLQFLINKNVLTVFSLLSSNPQLQAAANEQALALQQYETDVLSTNASLYGAFKQYFDDGSDVHHKKGANRQFLQKAIEKFENQGLLLSVQQRADVISLDKEIKGLTSQFNGNIIYDHRNIVVSLRDLKGIPESFIATLGQNESGDYVLPIDFRTFFMIMENCESEHLRKEYYVAFGQRAYPQNKVVLKELLAKRCELAQKLGHQDFASYELHGQMVKDSKKAESFLWHMVHELQKYDDQDFKTLTEHLPPSVQLLKHDKLKPWDEAFVKSYYRKNHFSVNDRDLSAYFPLDYTLDGLLRVFSKFFYVEFKKEEVAPDQLWASDVVCYRVYSLQSQTIIGYLFLDLYKHSYKKITEPCHFMLLPTVKDDCSLPCAGASVMVASFAQGTEDKPTLLELSEVTSLFHELGHALHALFGSACFVDYSGTQVVKDFVEVPSQMLEYWLEEPDVVQSISKHYQTGQPLSKNVIEQIVAAERFGKGSRMLKQAFLGLVSLYIHKGCADKDIHKLIEKMYKKVFKHVAYEPDHYVEYSFSHLAHYGASYYTYLWSRVIAADLYSHIKQHGGIYNYTIGKEYVKSILSPGGFISPSYMVKNFLNRPFSTKAFLQQLETKDLLK